MPIIRDYTQAYHATTTFKHLEIPMPNYVAGDLLIAILTTDTGTPTLMGGMPLKSCQYDDGGAFTDYTSQANNSTTGDFYAVPVTPAVNDAIYFGADVIFNQLNVIIGTAGAGTWTNVFEYCTAADGNTWADLADTDGTTSWKAVNTVNAAVTWTPAANWVKCTKNGIEAYYIRSRVSAYTSITTRTILTQAHVVPVNTRLNGWNPLIAYNGAQSSEAGIGVAWRIAGSAEVDTTIYYSNVETPNGAIISCRDTDLSVSTVINEFTGAGLATIAVDSANRTFTRSDAGGNFTTDGFVAGMTIRMTGFTDVGNNTTKLIESVTDTVITATLAAGLVTENGSGDERIWSSPFNSAAIYAAVSRAAADNTAGLGTGKSTMPSMTTDRNNCLLFYVYTITAAGVPSIIEGPCQLGAGKDGTAHADAWSWGFKATAGATPSTVVRSHMGALVAGSLVFAVNPPAATGALVIPGYTASDASVYVSPFTGAAYNGDTATATNTIATGFTGTINGKVLANGTTTVTRADAGINTYHAMHNVGGVVTPGAWAGNRTVIVARTTLASKNILFHIQPYMPIDIQTTDNVTLEGVMGLAIGLATSNGNFRVWHVGGAGSSWGIQRHQPVVINTDYAVTEANGGGLIQDTGAFNASSITQVGVMVSGKVVVPNWMVGSIWALDTCVIAGGSVAEPLNIEQTVAAYADGHERRSAIRQGSGQMLCLGPIQYGDGGTNPLYLELDSTAIEFPRIYDKTKKEVYYNSVANFAGLTYKPGPNDTVIHKNSVISSPSQFKWGLVTGSDVGATYDFSGLSVIGAGTISLAIAVTGGLTGLIINGYATLDISSLVLKNSSISNVATGNNKITINATSELQNCTVDLSNLAAGEYLLSSTDLTHFNGTTFTGKTTHNGGHAIRIDTLGAPASFDMTNVTFNEFGADTTSSAAILNNSGRAVTINVLGTGNSPTYKDLGAGSSTTIVAGQVSTTITVKDINTGVAIESARVLIEVADGTNFPYQESITIARTGALATVTHAGHGLVTGNKVKIVGANQYEYNGVKSITYIGVDSYSFVVAETPATPATGTITATMVIIDGATNASGVITDLRYFPASQAITGRVRKATTGTLYKSSPISGTIDNTTGFSAIVQMIPDV
jgi:hypothetical protein